MYVGEREVVCGVHGSVLRNAGTGRGNDSGDE